MALGISNIKSYLSTILAFLGISKSQFPSFAILAILGIFGIFLIKNNGIISIFYQIKSEKNNNLSKLIEAIDKLKTNNIPTMSTQNVFRVAIDITPTLLEIKFIADNVNNIKDFLHLKRVYSKLTFDEGKNIFLINKSFIPGWAFDAGYFLFAGISMFLFVLLLVAANTMHGMVLLCIALLLLTSFIVYFFLVWSSIYSSTKVLVGKKIVQEEKNVTSHFKISDFVFSFISMFGFLFGVFLLWLFS